ncbi:hypothetical protein [Kribbella sindirgiensis]|uniref:DUF4145 domain-containing protein n=1 Tax=Kribbella sindirgiensis TaxID=1124744 RepID=A0A4R0IQ45_9ACTN|nr:hypothetical protein [Kribbella sindirgiensis]TCC35107.1 hypothetical protein E0H50_14675 [Kribbella sindirgiensis]
MSALEFASAVIRALAWPLAALGIALLFRSKILQLLSPAMRRLIEGLAVLRNLAAHTDTETSLDRAAEYLAMTESVLYAIENPPK